MAQLPIVLIRC